MMQIEEENKVKYMVNWTMIEEVLDFVKSELLNACISDNIGRA